MHSDVKSFLILMCVAIVFAGIGFNSGTTAGKAEAEKEYYQKIDDLLLGDMALSKRMKELESKMKILHPNQLTL